MGVVTGLEASGERPGEVVVSVDGVPFATLPAELVRKLGLVVGAPFDAEGVPVASGAQGPESAKLHGRALRLLASRARSASELRARLAEKGDSEQVVASVVERLAESGLVDDRAFAEQAARAHLVRRGRSDRRARDEIVRKGVAPGLAAAAVRAVHAREGTDEAAVALRAAKKRARILAGLEPAERRRKLYAYLARRGYGPAVIRRAIEAALEALEG